MDLVGRILRHPFLVMLTSVALLATVCSAVTRLDVASGIDIFFAPDDPHLLAEQRLKDTYGREDNILIVIDASSSDVFTREHLVALEQLTNSAWLIPYARRVDSLANFLHPAVDGDDITIAPLVENADQLNAADIATVKTIAENEPGLVGRLLSEDSRVAAVNINLLLPAEQQSVAINEAVTAARALAEQFELTLPDTRVHLTGWAVTEQTLADITARDGTRLMPVLFALVLVVLAILLRSISAALCTVIVIALSVGAGMGFAGWVGISLNSVNVSAPTIILTLAVADCIHVLSAFLARLRTGARKRAALEHSLRTTLYPVVLTSVTTALGFLTLTLSESPPFRELGVIAAVGVMAALWVTVTILPALILLLPFSARPGYTGLPMTALAGFVVRYQTPLFWGFLGVIILSIAGIGRIELNDDPAGYFSEAVPLTRALEVVENRLSGTQTLHYSLQAGSADAITEPAFLADTDRFVQWLRAQPEVVNVESFTDTLKRLNQVMHDDDPAWHRLPDSREMAAQYTLLYEISVPYGQDATHRVSADKSSLRISATLKNQKSQGLLAFEARSWRWMEAHAPAIQTAAAGQSISFANVGLRNIKSMLLGSLVAVLLISSCLILAFRSVRFGLVSFIPNLFPALVTLGIWGAVVGEVNIAASVVFSLTLGIIVDDTTHFLVKYLHGRRQLGLSAEQAIKETFESVGRALVSTSIVLATGFLALVQSDFAVNATSGLLVAMTILIAIVLDLLFLPALLLRADKLLLSSKEATSAHPDHP